MGQRTTEFEEAWAAYCGVRHAVFMANGTVALEAVLRALGIGPGDEVITVSFTFNATVSAILAGGRAAGLRRRPRGRLLHGSGPGRGGDHAPHQGDHAGPPVRPDGRHGRRSWRSRSATGSRSSRTPRRRTARRTHGRRAGQFGPAMFSLYATKNLMTGEGGFATTDDDDAGRPAPPVPQPRDARPLPPRGAGHQLQAHGPRRRARARPAGPPRRADRAAPAERRSASPRASAAT